MWQIKKMMKYPPDNIYENLYTPEFKKNNILKIKLVENIHFQVKYQKLKNSRISRSSGHPVNIQFEMYMYF